MVAKGMRPEMARLTLARKIAAIVLIVWKMPVVPKLAPVELALRKTVLKETLIEEEPVFDVMAMPLIERRITAQHIHIAPPLWIPHPDTLCSLYHYRQWMIIVCAILIGK